ncbi:hypothetical protein JKP88DRAFT_346596 [Tribonema minus]|uniref:RING-type domain-containing protein n=1 Tax=Tribonema minus TaxID=303371 RepID=A0A835Z4Y2_9STRA|nr:hypothetical protein JKP88DRAFT_346596 [Tribonema minus]
MDAEEQQRRSLCEGEQPVQTRTTTTRFPGGVTVRTFRSGGGSAVSEHDLHELLHMLESLMTADGHLPTDGEGRRSSVSQAALDALTDRVLSAEEVAKLPESQRSCCICLEEFRAGQGVKWLECLHCFHTTCIDAALQRRDECPICKHRVGGGGPPSPDSRPPPSTGNASRPRLF